jgi:hypothetical protein
LLRRAHAHDADEIGTSAEGEDVRSRDDAWRLTARAFAEVGDERRGREVAMWITDRQVRSETLRDLTATIAEGEHRVPGLGARADTLEWAYGSADRQRSAPVRDVEGALRRAEAYTYEAAKADAVARVAPVLGERKDVARLRRAYDAAASVWYEPPRVQALCSVAAALARAGEERMAAETVKAAIGVVAAYKGTDGISQSQVFGTRILSGVPSKAALRLALSMATAIESAYYRVDALIIVAGAMLRERDSEGLRELLAVAEAIPDA